MENFITNREQVKGWAWVVTLPRSCQSVTHHADMCFPGWRKHNMAHQLCLFCGVLVHSHLPINAVW